MKSKHFLMFIINRLSKILDLNERRMLYYGLIYPLPLYGIVVWGHSAKALSRRIFVHQKRVVRYTAGLKHPESCRDSFRNIKIQYTRYTYKKQSYM
jgi:hypothetical protein